MDDDEDSEERDGHGLDKDSRMVERRERKAHDARPDALDPPFPFSIVQMDLILVQVNRNKKSQ